MNTQTIRKIALSLILGGTLSVALNTANAAPPGITLDISQTPLSVGASGVIPNIMLMLDNSGSMDGEIYVYSSSLTPASKPASYTTHPSCTNGPSGGANTNNATVVNMIVSSTGTPQFCTDSTLTTCNSRSNFSTSRCFKDNTKYYKVQYYNGAVLGTFLGLNLNWYFSASPGANAYFTATNKDLTAYSVRKTSSRMKMAKDAARNLVDSLVPAAGEKPTVRLGLTTFSGNTGGKLLVTMGDLTSDTTSSTSQAKKIKDAIGDTTLDSNGNVKLDKDGYGIYTGLYPDGYTPLAETLADIGRYFCTGYTGKLTLHPVGTAGTPTEKTINEIFGTYTASGDLTNNNNGLTNSTSPTVSPIPAPIQYYCQKSAVILITDGLPNKDREISSALRDYSGDCAAGLCNATPTSEGTADLPGVPLTGTSGNCKDNKYNLACKNGTKKDRDYETIGSDYLDDVAQALYEMDLRPTWDGITKPTGSKNNLKVYGIGISDPKLSADSVLRDAAIKGGGTFEYADDYNKLVEALDKMVADIKKGVGSFSAIAANATQLGTNSALFQAKYDTMDWTGDLIALPLTPSEDKNSNGKLDIGEDTIVINGKLDTGGVVLNPVWNAGAKIPAYLSRNIFTYNPSLTPKGVAFKNSTAVDICNKLTSTQKTALGVTSCASTDEGVWRLDWLRGDISHEEPTTTHAAAYTASSPDPRKNNSSPIFRNRARFYNEDTLNSPKVQGDTATHTEGELMKPYGWVAGGADSWLLGDIVDSDAVYVSNENYGYATKAGMTTAEKSSYANFVTSNNTRRKMIYIGANDALLHGFDARISKFSDADYAEAGKEILAYMPNTVFNVNGNLKNLSSLTYNHQYFVDGSPKVGDVYWGTGGSAAWHTVLVGTTGAGGKGIFALDITDPSNFDASDVLWEINTTDGPKTSDITTDTTTFRGFANNLGYTLPQASIGKMNNGQWAAIVANGYASANNLAVLYILNIQTGEIIAQFDTKTVSAGLSTPFAADVDGNGTIDAIYAGDLQGNMWKFDVSDSSTSKWKIAYGSSSVPLPLFTACLDASSTAACDLSRQHITNKPQVGKVGKNQTSNSVMVYFGTGKYIEDSDNNIANTKTQTFYGIWDECPLVSQTTGTHSCPSSVQKNKLLQQKILAQVDTPQSRLFSDNAINYPTHKGWYVDFVNPNTNKNEGERIVSASLLRGGRIIFVTLIPIPPDTTNTAETACVAGSKSTSWMTELNALSGSQLSSPALDINNDGKVDSADVVTFTVDGKTITAPPSSIKMTNGSTKTPAVMTNPGSDEIKFTGSSEGTAPSGIAESPAATSEEGAGRQSWRQL